MAVFVRRTRRHCTMQTSAPSAEPRHIPTLFKIADVLGHGIIPSG